MLFGYAFPQDRSTVLRFEIAEIGPTDDGGGGAQFSDQIQKSGCEFYGRIQTRHGGFKWCNLKASRLLIRTPPFVSLPASGGAEGLHLQLFGLFCTQSGRGLSAVPCPFISKGVLAQGRGTGQKRHLRNQDGVPLAALNHPPLGIPLVLAGRRIHRSRRPVPRDRGTRLRRRESCAVVQGSSQIFKAHAYLIKWIFLPRRDINEVG